MEHETKTLNVEGMSCPGCANNVENALGSVNGVERAEVDLEHNQAVVTYSPQLATMAHLEAAVRHAGYSLVGEAVSSAQKTACCGECS